MENSGSMYSKHWAPAKKPLSRREKLEIVLGIVVILAAVITYYNL